MTESMPSLIKTCLPDLQQSSIEIPLESINLSNNKLNMDKPSEFNLYKFFFNTTQHPAFIIDMNVNTDKAMPDIRNKASELLISYSGSDIFNESHLEKFNGTLSEFIYSSRRKPAQEIKHCDICHILVKTGPETTESIFSLSAASFDLGNDVKMLGILLMEISKTVKEELNALETFKSSLISSLSHELNNPMNSLIPLLKMIDRKSVV